MPTDKDDSFPDAVFALYERARDERWHNAASVLCTLWFAIVDGSLPQMVHALKPYYDRKAGEIDSAFGPSETEEKS
jgi:hypothetical protein